MTVWWQRGVVYQIYPRSFQDSNGDGIGDLAGLMTRLDYLVALGVDAIWLSPINPSPMIDFGYDVSDYTDIDPIFGTLADFDALLAAVHARGLKFILDLVPNHTSDQHAWFMESRSSQHNPKRDWYIWRDAGPDGEPPNNWISEFGGSSWTYDAASRQYYYHAYLAQQPDLNWRNPDVVAAMHDVMHFWLKRGVDGFRLDTIHHLIEDDALRDNPVNPEWHSDQSPTTAFERLYTNDRPETQDALAGLRGVTDAYEDRVLIGEAYIPLDALMKYYGTNGERLHLPFNFQLLQTPWNAEALAALILRYESLLPDGAWPNWVLGNHDRIRLASRVGPAQAGVAAMLLLTLRGTPTLYYGDEIGMTDVPIAPHLVQDPWEKNVPGFGYGRDPVRTPMLWDETRNAGFTNGMPWLPLADDAATRNVTQQDADPSSLLRLYKDLLALRRAAPALTMGDYGKIESHGDVLLYERMTSSQRMTIALNLGAAPETIDDLVVGRVMLSTTSKQRSMVQGPFTLSAHEGVIIAG